MEKLVKKTILPNGLTVISERIPGIRSVSLGFWVKAGSATDSVCQVGTAHFIEHMVFKGTERLSTYDIANSLESVGGTLNAFTSRDVTCIYAVVLDEFIDRAIDVISDMILNSTFQEHEIEQEKKVIIEEIHAANDVPEELVQDTFIDAILNPLPESKSILGNDESVASLSRVDLISYISKYHDPRNMIIAVAGNLDHDDIVRRLEAKMLMNSVGEFVSIKNKSVKYKPVHRLKRDISQTHLCVGVKTMGYTDKRHMSLWLMNTVLGYGMSSRLFQIIREKYGLAYSICSFTELLSSVGVIATYAATDAVNCDKVLQLIHEEYERLSAELIDEATFNDAKSQMKGNLILSLESSYSRMCRLAKQELYLGYYRDITDIINEIEAVSPEDIIHTAQELFVNQRPFVVLVTP